MDDQKISADPAVIAAASAIVRFFLRGLTGVVEDGVSHGMQPMLA